MTESDLPEYFYKELTPDQQKELCDFIKVNFIKIKSFNEKQDSNSLHGRFHKFHVSNGSFKEAMRLCGFSQFPLSGIFRRHLCQASGEFGLLSFSLLAPADQIQ